MTACSPVRPGWSPTRQMLWVRCEGGQHCQGRPEGQGLGCYLPIWAPLTGAFQLTAERPAPRASEPQGGLPAPEDPPSWLDPGAPVSWFPWGRGQPVCLSPGPGQLWAPAMLSVPPPSTTCSQLGQAVTVGPGTCSRAEQSRPDTPAGRALPWAGLQGDSAVASTSLQTSNPHGYPPGLTIPEHHMHTASSGVSWEGGREPETT